MPTDSPPRSRTEILGLLSARGAHQAELHAAAREARRGYWRRAAIVRGVIEVTNICRCNCEYFPMRRDNPHGPTPYVLTPEEILEAARLECLQTLIQLSYKTGTGIITGLPGQTLPERGG